MWQVDALGPGLLAGLGGPELREPAADHYPTVYWGDSGLIRLARIASGDLRGAEVRVFRRSCTF